MWFLSSWIGYAVAGAFGALKRVRHKEKERQPSGANAGHRLHAEHASDAFVAVALGLARAPALDDPLARNDHRRPRLRERAHL